MEIFEEILEMKGNSSGPNRGSGFNGEFIDLLFSWSIEKIFDENMYQLQVYFRFWCQCLVIFWISFSVNLL